MPIMLFNVPCAKSIVKKFFRFNTMKLLISLEELTCFILIGSDSIVFSIFLFAYQEAQS